MDLALAVGVLLVESNRFVERAVAKTDELYLFQRDEAPGVSPGKVAAADDAGS